MNYETIKGLLDEFLQTHYNGSFSRMACDYIHATGMTEEEVEALLEAMKHSSVLLSNYNMKINQLGFYCISKLNSPSHILLIQFRNNRFRNSRFEIVNIVHTD